MSEANASAEVVITIIIGILQLIVAIISLLQQHYLRLAACAFSSLNNVAVNTDVIVKPRLRRRRSMF